MADHLVEQMNIETDDTEKAIKELIEKNLLKCSNCSSQNFTDLKQFNLMFQTDVGSVEGSTSACYLRPETAQGIFINFHYIYKTMRKELPFGIGQIGRSFRNEVSPGNFLFRTREFEQMELEYFCKPNESPQWFDYWVKYCHEWLLTYGVKPDSLRLYQHPKEKLSHYSAGTTDIEYSFPFGWGEIWGIANRTDYDLQKHQEYSQSPLTYKEENSNDSYFPHIIEPAAGLDRIFLAFLCDAYNEEIVPSNKSAKEDKRIVLKLNKNLAPYRCAILPLMKKDHLLEKSENIYKSLSRFVKSDFDVTGTIGKRYRRQDEIGTPFCVTIDFDTLENDTVTVRDRDSMKQTRLSTSNLLNFLNDINT